jgi:transposase-like protein
MPAAPGTIEQLARDVALNTDAENALRALRALRGELDMLESELVTRAIRTGASWSQVARALGISKQAAHKKHRRVADPGPPVADAASAAAGGPRILVTSEARRSIELAREEARLLGQATLGTEHILLGILRCQRSHAVKALNALGITLESARACLQPTIVASPSGVDSSQPKPARGNVSPHARRILEGSLREAVKRQEGYIGVEHLLLALLADSRNGATQTLEALRATPTQIRRQLDREWQAIVAAAPVAASPSPPSQCPPPSPPPPPSPKVSPSPPPSPSSHPPAPARPPSPLHPPPPPPPRLSPSVDLAP